MSSLRWRQKRGQGMTEYIIIIAIVAIGAIMIIGLFGKKIKHAFTRIGTSIDGTETGQDSAGDAALSGEAGVQDGMNTFDADTAQ